jgi:hypothetical protein
MTSSPFVEFVLPDGSLHRVDWIKKDLNSYLPTLRSMVNQPNYSLYYPWYSRHVKRHRFHQTHEIEQNSRFIVSFHADAPPAMKSFEFRFRVNGEWKQISVMAYPTDIISKLKDTVLTKVT